MSSVPPSRIPGSLPNSSTSSTRDSRTKGISTVEFPIGISRQKLSAPKLPKGPNISQNVSGASFHVDSFKSRVKRLFDPSFKSPHKIERRVFLQVLGIFTAVSSSIAAEQAYGGIQTLVSNLTGTNDPINQGLANLKKQHPSLVEFEKRYDATMSRKLGRGIGDNGTRVDQDFSNTSDHSLSRDSTQTLGQKSRFSLEQGYNPRLSFEVNGFVNVVSSALGLDIIVVKRLIVHESKGNAQAVSHKSAQGIMQILPSTAADIREREAIYAPYIKRAGLAIKKNLHQDSALKKMLTVYLNEFLPFSDRVEALRAFRSDLFDQELNLFAGQIYLAMLRDYTAKRLPEFEKRVPEIYESITAGQLEAVNRSRRAIGESPLTLEYVREVFSGKLEASARKTIEAQVLAQYNGGSQPRTESYLYSLVLQG